MNTNTFLYIVGSAELQHVPPTAFNLSGTSLVPGLSIRTRSETLPWPRVSREVALAPTHARGKTERKNFRRVPEAKRRRGRRAGAAAWFMRLRARHAAAAPVPYAAQGRENYIKTRPCSPVVWSLLLWQVARVVKLKLLTRALLTSGRVFM